MKGSSKRTGLLPGLTVPLLCGSSVSGYVFQGGLCNTSRRVIGSSGQVSAVSERAVSRLCLFDNCWVCPLTTEGRSKSFQRSADLKSSGMGE